MAANSSKGKMAKPENKLFASLERSLLDDVRLMIIEAREGVARAIDSGMTALYWSIGTRIRKDILKENRAEYGHEIVSALGRQLSSEFGRGFSEKNLRHMIRFSEAFPQSRIVSALRRQLTWTHIKLYLGWLDRYERKPGEESPIGLILCAGKRRETVELMDLEGSGIKVSSYLTKALPKEELERKLHEAVKLARALIEGRESTR